MCDDQIDMKNFMRDSETLENEAQNMYSLLVRLYRDIPLEELMDEIEQLLKRIDDL